MRKRIGRFTCYMTHPNPGERNNLLEKLSESGKTMMYDPFVVELYKVTDEHGNETMQAIVHWRGTQAAHSAL
jgi:hypothetical protein